MSKVLEHRRYQFLSARVLRDCCRFQKFEQIVRLTRCLRPRCRGSCQELRLQLLLLTPQSFLICLDFGEEATNLRGLLGSHSTMAIERDGLVRHDFVQDAGLPPAGALFGDCAVLCFASRRGSG